MREILFRGFYPCDGPDTIVVDGEKVKGRWVEGYLWSKRTIGVTSPCGNLDEVVVLPSTVGQYTGLTDKNGKRVFEGDRLRWDEDEWGGPNIEEVKWDYDLISERKSDWEEFCEVIGTVFDEEAPNET